jgi:apolipoprotein N-acyltransferase
MSNASNPAFRASVAGVATAYPITAHPPADAIEPPSNPHRLGGVHMIHALLVVAVILFVLWLLFHATGGLVNLIWLVIIVLVGLWLFGLIRSRSTR